jgi:hypothetical protein
LRQTLKELTAVLHKVNEIKAEPKQALLSPLNATTKVHDEKGVQSLAVALIDETSRKANELDMVYAEKLGTIRKRLRSLGTVPAPMDEASTFTVPSRLGRRSLLLTLIVQLAIAWLMIMAADARAKQLFLTTYHDSFHSQDFFSIPQSTSGTLLAPLLQEWNVIPATSHVWQDNTTLQDWTWTQTFTQLWHHVIGKHNRTTAWKVLAFKLSTALGFQESDTLGVQAFVPT